MVNNMLFLELLSTKHLDELLKYRDEIIDLDYPRDGTGGLTKSEDILEWYEQTKKMENKETTPPLLVPANQYVLTDGSIIYGMVNIRKELNENLYNYGGHIGYNIRPKYQNQGLGELQLSLALQECKKLNITKVYIMCKDTNIASRKIILANKGVYLNTIQQSINYFERYLIDND